MALAIPSIYSQHRGKGRWAGCPEGLGWWEVAEMCEHGQDAQAGMALAIAEQPSGPAAPPHLEGGQGLSVPTMGLVTFPNTSQWVQLRRAHLKPAWSTNTPRGTAQPARRQNQLRALLTKKPDHLKKSKGNRNRRTTKK